MWLFKKTAINNEDNLKLITRAKAHCALTVRHLMKDQRSIDACEIALKFADGLATREELAAADADAARIKNQQETADICRKYLPIELWNIVED